MWENMFWRWVGEVSGCVIGKLNVSKSMREFLYSVFWVSSWEVITFRQYSSSSLSLSLFLKYTHEHVILRVKNIDQLKLTVCPEKEFDLFIIFWKMNTKNPKNSRPPPPPPSYLNNRTFGIFLAASPFLFLFLIFYIFFFFFMIYLQSRDKSKFI